MPAAKTASRVAVFDLDGTVTRRDTYVDFLLYTLAKRPARLVCLPALAWYLLVHKLGMQSNHWLKARYLGAVAGGLSKGQLAEICENFVSRTRAKNIKQPALDELARLRHEGYVLVLATASFGFYVRNLSAALKFDEVLCTEALFDDNDELTGELDGKNCIGVEKARRIAVLLSERGWSKVELGYSDSKVDLPMLEMADRALVVDPSVSTQKVAVEKGFEILWWR